MKIGKWLILTLVLMLVMAAGACAESVAMPDGLEKAAQEALLDGCQNASFMPALWFDDTYVYGELLVGDAEWLAVSQADRVYDVYALFSHGVFGWREDMLVDEFTFSIAEPIHLRFEQAQDGTFRLTGYDTPDYASYEEEIRRIFPAQLQERLIGMGMQSARDTSAYENLYARAQAYFKQTEAEGFWRVALPFDIEDEAYESIRTCFADYPQWVGRLIRHDGSGAFITYTLSVDGDGYHGVLTFDAYNAASEHIEHAVVQYVGDELKVIEGSLPIAG